jgi:putative tricarboxylic transport membrane protein
MGITRRLALALTCAAGLMTGVAGMSTSAYAWEPTKPIDFVIMAGAGGGADQIARFVQSVAEKHKMMPRPLVPNNKGGGSGAEALIALNTTSDPDHTILVTLNSFFTTPIRQAEPWRRHQDIYTRLHDGRGPVHALGAQGLWHHHVRAVG